MPVIARPLAIAHRGDPVAERENTVPALEAAIARGAAAIEVDVQLAADGTPVVVHDATFERLWGDPRPVGSLSWPEIARLGRPGVRVPQLEELLELSISTGVRLVLDQKDAAAGAAAARLVERVGAERTAFCGSTEGLLDIRRGWSKAVIFYNSRGLQSPDVRILAEMRPQYYNPCWPTLSRATVDAMHSFGIGVSCWTPNTDADLALVLDLGVDAVMTDHIGALTALLDARGPYDDRAAVPWP
ncbi:MAG TPA: glycerophosphodiester phosphodiesterase [Pengzhenrongella sp.]